MTTTSIHAELTALRDMRCQLSATHAALFEMDERAAAEHISRAMRELDARIDQLLDYLNEGPTTEVLATDYDGIPTVVREHEVTLW